MRPWQNGVALAATLLAAGVMLPLEPRVRLLLAGLAAVVVCVLLALRLRAHAARRDDARVAGVYDRLARIRRQREKRRR